MKKLGSTISIVLISIMFLYSMIYISNKNECSGIRIYDCKKENNKNLVSNKKYIELKETGDIFLKSCKPNIKELENIYLLDYSDCDLKLEILKEKPWVESVNINGKQLTREEINSNF